MKKNLLNPMNSVFFLLLLCLITGCVKKEDLYNPDFGKQPLPDPNDYFDFSMRTNVDLYVDYGISGFKALIEIYDEDPLASEDNQRLKKEGVEPLFKIYTDENGKFKGKMNIPAAVKSVYLYTGTWGLPGCVELNVEDGAVRYAPDTSEERSTRAMTRSYSYPSFSGDGIPYELDEERSLYSICKWNELGNIRTTNNNYVSTLQTVGEEKMSDFASRMKSFFIPDGVANPDNSQYVQGPETTNLHLKEEAKINLVFVNKDTKRFNAFGYYYYKGDDNSVDVKKIRKYIIFPWVNIIWEQVLLSGDRVQLKFFGEDGESAPSETFPAGYTIGWFIYSNGFSLADGQINGNHLGSVPSLITTNDVQSSYVTLADKKSGKLIIGVEDGKDQSFCDMLFYTEASPESAIGDSHRPVIPEDDQPTVKPDESESMKGTLAFEDVWPNGGDYDMNDVIVEYERKVFFNNLNMVTKIEDTFKPVYDGATYTNAFAYQTDKEQLGKVTLPEGAIMEEETSSIIVYPNNKASMGKTYTIMREFASPFDKQNMKAYNPYIIVNYVKGERQRKEVHLPKTKATSMADQTLIGTKDEAYYLDRSGAYPFAIDIPVWNFKPVTETKHIDEEYPRFKKWADSKGVSDEDWYK